MCTVELLSRSLTRILQSYKASLGARKNRRRPLFSMLMAITLALLGWAVQCRLLVLLNFVFRKVGYDKLPHPLLFQFSNTMAGISKKYLFCSLNWSRYYNFQTHGLYYNTTSLLLGSSYDQIKV